MHLVAAFHFGCLCASGTERSVSESLSFLAAISWSYPLCRFPFLPALLTVIQGRVEGILR